MGRRLLGKVGQYGIDGGIAAELQLPGVGQRLLIPIQIRLHGVVVLPPEAILQQRNVVAHIVLGLPGLGNTFLQVLILQALHGQRIVLLLQGNQLLLLQHQSGHHIVHQRRRHRRRKPQSPPEGIEGHGQKGQEVRQRINADLQHPI